MPAVLAFVFGMLLFLMSTAVLALEGSADGLALWRLPLLTLAMLHAVAGFMVTGGQFHGARWTTRDFAGPATASAFTSAAMTLVAFYLAGKYRIMLGRGTAALVVIATLTVGAAALLIALRARRLAGRRST